MTLPPTRSASSTSTPSSSSSGFFQPSPCLANQFSEDDAIRRAFALFLPEDVQFCISPDLESFGSLVLSRKILAWVESAERNPPFVKIWDTWGRRCDTLVTSEGWRSLQALGIKEGIVAIAYEGRDGQYSRLHQFLKIHLWTGSAAMVTCPSAMQDGAAALLYRQLHGSSTLDRETRDVMRSAFARLTSRNTDMAWTSGQWMTERSGGSDVRGTETWATSVSGEESHGPCRTALDGSKLGPWQIHGFKWFSSATDADMTVLLAKTHPDGALSAFFAPVQCTKSVDFIEGDNAPVAYNGVRIHRLKQKLGTRALPTAELELCGMRAHLLGKLGEGTREISSVLNITRVHTAVSAVGNWGRGLAIARAYARVRAVGGRLLMDVPAHVKGLAELHVKYRANMLFTFFVVSLLGMVEHADKATVSAMTIVPQGEQAAQLLRLLTPVLKTTVSAASITGLRHCMEALGGIGYLENDEPFNVARLFRDTAVLSIWEGTTNVLAADTVRVLKGRDAAAVLSSLEQWVHSAIARFRNTAEEWLEPCEKLMEMHSTLQDMVSTTTIQELQYRGTTIMDTISTLVCGILLVEDAVRDGNSVATEIARRYLIAYDSQSRSRLEDVSWTTAASWDRRIVFGDDACLQSSKITSSHKL